MEEEPKHAQTMEEFVSARLTNFFAFLESRTQSPVPDALKDPRTTLSQVSHFCNFLRSTSLCHAWNTAIDRLQVVLPDGDADTLHEVAPAMDRAGLAIPEEKISTAFLLNAPDFLLYLTSMLDLKLVRKDILRLGAYMELLGQMAVDDAL